MIRTITIGLGILTLGALLGCAGSTSPELWNDESEDRPFAEQGEPAHPVTLNPSRDEGQLRWPSGPHELQVSLSVVHALEEGPVVCQVTLKNVSQVRLWYATSMFNRGAFCRLDTAGRARMESPLRPMLICGCIGPYTRDLYPGQTASETFYLHGSFQSLPPGKATAHFGWSVYRVVNKPEANSGLDWSLDLLFELQGSQTVAILPAAENNLAPLLAHLEAEFARVAKETEGRSDYIWCSHDPTATFVETMENCRHKEFVPLLLQAMERLPAAQFRQQFVATVYESFATSEEGFTALADYLASPHPAAAVEVFGYWAREDRDHEESKRRQEELRRPLPPEPDPVKAESQALWRALQRQEEEAWKDSKRHADTRLTKEQFGRLLEVKDVWVRALLYAHYPDRCPADWIETLHKDFRQIERVPERFEELLAQLDDDSFKVRQQATAELIESGPTFAWHLWAVSHDKLSLEAAYRLRMVLEKVKKPEFPHLWRRTISHLTWDPKPHNQKPLNVLKSSVCPGLVSRAAQEAFEEYNQRTRDHAAVTTSGVEKDGEKR